MRQHIQRFGSFLAAMVVPNIGAFIAWGLITALFIPTGWIPNEDFAKLVGPMITYLLPTLIGYTGGKMIHDTRGGVVGAAATMGVIVGADIPMFIGAMVMGPLGGYLMKKIDEFLEDRMPTGFEMLINNFSAGFLVTGLVLLANVAIGPVVEFLSDGLGAGVQFLIDSRLLPVADILIEPAKVLFLNNAINHGILGPLGVAEVKESGKAIHFLLESNPGPGLGLLLAFWFAGKGNLKQSAPGAAVIHFLGGIHEIYFPYILARPMMIVAMWAGGIVADLWFVIWDAGLVATPSPGSIFAYFAVIPRGGHFAVLGGVVVGVIGSFVVGSVLLKLFPGQEAVEAEQESAEMTGATVAAH
ncbi:PTS system mannitol-specific IIC component [Herpetosiphon giganteus]|nr:PTS mannitol transporter subunit IICB [Herpetosiphon giganteus]MBM7844925.1 PTS system mannitol-specific IIC component [Herpetosiphon giganteus]